MAGLPLSGIRVLDSCCVILRSGGGDVAAAATKNLGGRLREEQPPPQILRGVYPERAQILRYDQNDRARRARNDRGKVE